MQQKTGRLLKTYTEWVRLLAAIACLLLAGCGSLEKQLRDNLDHEQRMAVVCADPAFSQPVQKNRYQSDLSELVKVTLGFDVPIATRMQAKTFLQSVTDVHEDLNGIYQFSGPGTQGKISQVRNQIQTIRTGVVAMRQSIQDKVSAALAQNPVSAANALADFESLVRVIAPEVRNDMTTIESDLITLNVALRDAIAAAASDQTLMNSPDGTKALAALPRDMESALVAEKKIMAQLRTTNLSLNDAEKKVLSTLMQDLITYETARFVMLEVARGARSVEYKLDQMDDKTWFLLSVAGLAASPALADRMADAIRNVFLDATLNPLEQEARDTLKVAFIVASCSQLGLSAENVPTNTVRAYALLRPFFEAIVELGEPPSPSGASPRVGSVPGGPMAGGANPNAGTPVAFKPPPLTAQQIAQRASMRLQASRDTLKEYRIQRQRVVGGTAPQ